MFKFSVAAYFVLFVLTMNLSEANEVILVPQKPQ